MSNLHVGDVCTMNDAMYKLMPGYSTDFGRTK